MKKNRRRRNLLLAISSKARIAQQSNLAIRAHHTPSHHSNTGNIQGWYAYRKKANIRLRNLSKSQVVIHEGGYRGDHMRHWLQDLRCEHLFRASLKEVVIVGADKICPFCHGTKDMDRYGTIGAVQEHVYGLSNGNIGFLPDNILSSSSEHYWFNCSIHKIRFECSFDRFLDQEADVCPFCDHEKFNWTVEG